MALIERLARWPALAGALIVGIALGAPLLAGRRFMGLDHTRNLLPTLCAHDDLAAEGALLDEALGGGSPLLEDPLGLVFSPVAFLLRPLAAEDRASAFTWIFLVAAALTVAYLGRSFGLSRRARLALAVAWPLSGTALNLVLHGPYIAELPMIPLVWGGLRHLRRAPTVRARDLCAVAFGLGLLALHGGLQACLWLGLIGAVELLAALLRGGKGGRRSPLRAALIGAALGSGVLLASLQALPTLGLGGAAARATGVEDTAVWSLAPPEAFGVLWPLVATERTAVGASLVTSWHGTVTARPAWNVSPYLGLVAIAAMLAVGRARRARPLVALAALSGAMAAGAATPIYGLLLTVVPPLALFRYPARYFVLTSLAVMVLAALALDAATRSSKLRASVVRWLAALAALSAAACVAVLWQGPSLDAAERLVTTRAAIPGEPSLQGLLLAAGATSSCFAIAIAALLARVRAAARAPLAVFALPASLALAAPSLISLGAPLFDPERQPPLALPARDLPPRAEAGAPPRMVCIGRSIMAMHVDLAGSPLEAEGDLMVDLADHKPDVSRCGGPATPHIGLPSSQRATMLLSRAIDEGRGVLMPARALGCTHLVTRAPVDQASLTRVPLTAPSYAASYYAIAKPMPDASIAKAPRLLKLDEQTLLEEVTRAPDSSALRDIVDDPSGALPARLWAALPDGARAGAVTASFTRPDRGTVSVSGEGGALVVLRRPWWPGFVARQGSRPVFVVRVAGAQLGLVVDDVAAGPIEVRYRARLLSAGVASGLLGLLALVVSLGWLRRHQRRSRAAARPARRGGLSANAPLC